MAEPHKALVRGLDPGPVRGQTGICFELVPAGAGVGGSSA